MIDEGHASSNIIMATFCTATDGNAGTCIVLLLHVVSLLVDQEWEHGVSTGFTSTEEESGIEMGEIRFAEPVQEVRYADDDNEYVSRSGARV